MGGLGSLASLPLWGQLLNNHPCYTEKAAGDVPGIQVVKHPPCKVGDAGPILSQAIKTPHAAEQLSPHATTPELLCPSPQAPQQERLRDLAKTREGQIKTNKKKAAAGPATAVTFTWRPFLLSSARAWPCSAWLPLRPPHLHPKPLLGPWLSVPLPWAVGAGNTLILLELVPQGTE